MCRLFGLCAAEPVSATFWLLQAPDSLRRQSHREPDGTGLGFFDAQGTPHVEKQPLAAFHDRAFAQEARTVRSATFVAHVRFASTGALELRNTHPFEQQGRLFAHNGVIGDTAALDRRLGAASSLVGGDTDSERFFALITTEIDRHDGDVAAGISAAVAWVAAHLPVLSLNFVLIDGEQLWALRYPDTHELHILERAAGSALDQVSSQSTRIHSDEAATQSTVIVATELLDADTGWRALLSGELIHVDRSQRVASQTIIDTPPAQPLTLADLGGHARQSQA
jgi:predicted glutamine amidotransferase